MSKFSRLLIAAFALTSLGASACIFVQTGTVSSSAGKGNSATASASDWGILHLTAPEGLTSTVNSQLLSQCPSGKVSNVSTQFDAREFFVAQLYTVTASGQCQ
ncbi:MAG TPA: hypothetical protein VEC38_12200 [Candidatus Binataceae bacterium]|nr:hypothetical protein [Candidatus Binataceae bacterium]